jgi:hypothetical protein
MSHQSPNWNPESHDIFRNGPDDRLNACVGSNGGPYDFLHYGCGYLTAAEALCEHVEQERSYIDSKIYPAIFMLRHGIELYLKGLLERIPPLFNELPLRPHGHHVGDLWSQLKPFLHRRRAQFDDGHNLVAFMDQAVASIEIIDRNAQVFRYPNPQPSTADLLGRYSHINFGRVREFTNKVFLTFEAWLYTHDDILDEIQQAEQIVPPNGP